MSKQWVRHQVRRNELQDAVDGGLIWITANRQIAGGAVLALVALVLGGIFLAHRSRGKQEEAWNRLSMAQAYAYGGRPADAITQIGELSRDFSATKASGYARLFAGDLQYRLGSYKEAVDSYAPLLEGGNSKELAPLALAGTVAAQEAAGQAAEAAGTAQRFLDSSPDHFLAPQVHTALARNLLASGQAEQAKVTWQKITLQYPETPWAGLAQARLQNK